MQKFRLVVSDTLRFTARFAFNDEGAERVFVAKLQARRTPGAQFEAALRAQPVFVDFLRACGLTLLGWEGESPLVDEQGNAAPANADALDALLAEPGMPNVLLAAYVEANGAKAKLGN